VKSSSVQSGLGLALGAALLFVATGQLRADDVGGETVVIEQAEPPSAAPDEYVGDEVCVTCHEALHEGFAADYAQTRHAKVFTEVNAREDSWRNGCEACHGAGGAHVAAGGGKGVGGLISFEGNDPEDVERYGAVCMQCHSGGERRFWEGTVHHPRDVSCSSCHTVMRKESATDLLSKRTQVGTCGGCHQIQNARQYRNAHMPLRPGEFNSSTADDGKMVCGSCHNPHGTISEKLTAGVTVNESCLSCHADKRGPFLWEHMPVTEDCLNCHDPHGTTRAGMLKMGVPRLCNSCHNSNFHPSSPQSPTARFVLGSSCLQCHPSIHGSNHPSGMGLTR
jgi:DmsE family decaheme c-type cytochrome